MRLRSRILILGAAMAVQSVPAATTNLAYTVGQINTALGIALDNTDSAPRLAAMETFLTGSNGFAHIERTTEELDTALGIAESNVNFENRLDVIENNLLLLEGQSFPEVVFTNVVVAAALNSPSSYTALDLSPWVGSNRSMVLLEVSSTDVATDKEFRCRMAGGSAPVYSGVGFALISTNAPSVLLCVTDGSGIIEVSSSVEMAVSLTMYVRGEQ